MEYGDDEMGDDEDELEVDLLMDDLLTSASLKTSALPFTRIRKKNKNTPKNTITVYESHYLRTRPRTKQIISLNRDSNHFTDEGEVLN
jgi:hypothetical protein